MTGATSLQTLDQSGQQTVVDGGVYNVHCNSSSDFVVGRQTNFHAPVTIINCPSPYPDEPPDSIVIRDQLWSQEASKTFENEAGKTDLSTDSIANRLNGHNGVFTETNMPPGVRKKGQVSCAMQKFCKTRHLGLPTFFWVVIICALLICFILAFTQLSSGKWTTTTPTTDDKIWIGDQSHLYFTKKQWGGLNSSSKVIIHEPTLYVIISHTASGFCYETDTCQELIRGIQRYHMSRTPPFADIGYNFLVGGDGYIYEGRGWGVRSPHEGFTNNLNIDINLIGDFSVFDVPTPTQVDAVKELLERGVQDCHLDSNYILVAHNATENTLSPGKNVYAIISEWDHFEPNPKANLTRRLGMPSACASPSPKQFVIKNTVPKNETLPKGQTR